MPTKHLKIAEIGQVSIYKRRNAQSLRITIIPNGGVRVTIPSWLPYKAGLEYAKSKSDWIKKNSKAKINLLNGKKVGKYHRLVFIASKRAASVIMRVSDNNIRVTYPDDLTIHSVIVQSKALDGIDKALRQEAEQLLPQRLRQLADKYEYDYSNVTIRKLKSRWGSCNQHHQITLNLYLMMLPWSLIDYVLVHELNHTKHLNHSSAFWYELESKMPNAKDLRKELRLHHPSL